MANYTDTYTTFFYQTFSICLLAVTILAFVDFHSPYSPEEFRHAVTRRRYIVGAAAYTLGAILLFFLLVPLVSRGIQFLLPQAGAEKGEITGRAATIASTGVLLFFILLR